MKKSLSFFIFSIYCFISLYPQNEKQCNILLLNQKLKDTVNIKAEQRKEYEREFWFLSSRYDSLGGILGYVDAMNGFYSNLKNQSNNKSNVLLSQQDIQWNYLGPIGLDFKGNLHQADNSIGRGWINSIKVINNDTIYAGARNSGLWLTQNGGDS